MSISRVTPEILLSVEETLIISLAHHFRELHADQRHLDDYERSVITIARDVFKDSMSIKQLDTPLVAGGPLNEDAPSTGRLLLLRMNNMGDRIWGKIETKIGTRETVDQDYVAVSQAVRSALAEAEKLTGQDAVPGRIGPGNDSGRQR